MIMEAILTSSSAALVDPRGQAMMTRRKPPCVFDSLHFLPSFHILQSVSILIPIFPFHILHSVNFLRGKFRFHGGRDALKGSDSQQNYQRLGFMLTGPSSHAPSKGDQTSPFSPIHLTTAIFV
ncbi:hypothetical protein M0R45_005425 [Rubus argutus]|uniref:Uncharacterized protein n=1 Tax=Rubus argutus TaxID=59490 RepID=A0AAW1YMN7_RUBAR